MSAAPCPNGCDHSDEEHHAFDRGVADGEAGKDWSSNPYRGEFAHDWLAGLSVGQSNREFEAAELLRAQNERHNEERRGDFEV